MQKRSGEKVETIALETVRDWSLITGKGATKWEGGGLRKKGGGGEEKALAMLKGGGETQQVVG